MFAVTCLLLVVSATLSRAAVQIYDYNKIEFEEHASFESFKRRYLTNPGQTFAQNVFLGVADEECVGELSSPAFRGAQRHGQAIAATLPKSQFPISIENCAEVFFYRVNTGISNPWSSEADFDHPAMNSFVHNQMFTEGIAFRNNFPYRVDIYWHEENSEPQLQLQLDPGEATVISSFLGHIFSANAAEETEGVEYDYENGVNPAYQNIVDYMSVDGGEYVFSPLNRQQTCELVPGTKMTFVEKDIATDSDHAELCANMLERFTEFINAEWNVRRLGLNYVQPQLIEGYSEMGFTLQKLPADTYKWLKAWYDAQQQNIEVTESGVGPCMNQHVAPTNITHLVPELKNRLSSEVGHILEEWAGLGELELTSIYGIRKYNNGSILRMHVDTARTHAVSRHLFKNINSYQMLVR